MPKDSACEVEEKVVLLSEATRTNCRWIVGHARRGVFAVCGRQVRTGSSFCDEHHELVWRPPAGERKGRLAGKPGDEE